MILNEYGGFSEISFFTLWHTPQKEHEGGEGKRRTKKKKKKRRRRFRENCLRKTSSPNPENKYEIRLRSGTRSCDVTHLHIFL
jgi:hypothetical protein